MVSPSDGDGEGPQGIYWQFDVKNYFQDETSIEFAERVKHEIAKKGGLVELLWDGNLKRNKVRMLIDAKLFQESFSVIIAAVLLFPEFQVKSEWKVAAQQQFVRRIKGEREI